MSYIVTIIGTYINSLSFENKDDAIIYAINVIIDRINSATTICGANFELLNLFNLINAGKYEEAIEKNWFVKIEELKLRSFPNGVIKTLNKLNKEMIFK